jgi:hypothetical protein
VKWSSGGGVVDRMVLLVEEDIVVAVLGADDMFSFI